MSNLHNMPRTIWWENDAVMLIDQTRLPLVGDVLVCNRYEGVCTAIRTLAVRGAPALGVAAALGIALWVVTESDGIETVDELFVALDRVAREITSTRPTAVNLFWGAERMRALARDRADLPLKALKDLLVAEALAMQAEDEARNRAIGSNGAEIIAVGSRILTHCNAGSLATAFYGTALGVIFSAAEQGKVERVWVDETRPVLQGARLTAWELRLAGIPHTLITDSMAAHVMRRGEVDAVVVGADRIAANGDVVNKIGTYGLAILAKEHGIPFYVAAPTSTVDLTLPDGDAVVIEERDEREVTGVTVSGTFQADSPIAVRAFDSLTEREPYHIPLERGHQVSISRKGAAYQFDMWARIAPPGVAVYNPAFDVTPAAYVSAIVTECGVARPEYTATLALVCEGAGGIAEISRR